MENEIWKPIQNYESIYEVSNLGNVKSLDRIVKYKDGRQCFCKGKILKPSVDINGYLYAVLSKNGISTNVKIHRLVAQAFIPNSESYPFINHKDEDKTNNCADNLEWCTTKYNNNYGTHNKKLSTSKTLNNILQFSLDGQFIKEWLNPREVERELNIDNASIYRVLNNKQHTAGGYIWRHKK